MSKRDRIDLALLCAIFSVILGLCSYVEYKDQEPQMVEEMPRTIETQADTGSSEFYYLAELNGYVVVYLADQKTIYEFTNILIQELPEEIQEEIQNGKRIHGMENVYGFLENYSS